MDIASVVTTLVGGAGGGVLRLVPEVFKIWDRRNERTHELALGEQQQRLLQLQSSTHLAEVGAQGEQTQAATALEALRDAIKSQGAATGVKWVDALSASVRPVWTYYVLLIYGAVKVTDTWFAIARHLDWEHIRPLVWGPEDAAMVAALSTFWFLDRVIRKQGR